MKRVATSLVLALLAASAAAGPTPSKLIDATAREGRRALQNSLKDPESMRLRNTFVSVQHKEDDDGKPIELHFLCGEVNAKNSHGGYVGFSHFAANSAGALIASGPDDESFDEVIWQRSCAHKIREIR